MVNIGLTLKNLYALGLVYFSIVFTKSTRANPHNVTTPEQTKEAKEAEKADESARREGFNDKHSTAQDNDDSVAEAQALADMEKSEAASGLLDKAIKALKELVNN